MSEKTGYFKTAVVGNCIWSISGLSNDLMYLVAGKEKAMLVDTGMGIGNLAALVKSLTNLPIVVVNTHGHPDHAGGNSNFDQVWLHPKDEIILRQMSTVEYRRNDIKVAMGEGNPDFEHLVTGLVEDKPYKLHYLKQGHLFDLGDRKFEVIEIPGHTPGSVVLLCSKEKIMFTGDSVIATPAWLHLKHSLPLHTYLEGLRKVKGRDTEYDTLFPGHAPAPIKKNLLYDLISCAEAILKNLKAGVQTKTFAGVGLALQYGSAQIIYNPDNL